MLTLVNTLKVTLAVKCSLHSPIEFHQDIVVFLLCYRPLFCSISEFGFLGR